MTEDDTFKKLCRVPAEQVWNAYLEWKPWTHIVGWRLEDTEKFLSQYGWNLYELLNAMLTPFK